MKTKEQNVAAVAALRDGESVTVFWAEGGGAIVRRVGETLALFEVPQYGGEEQFFGAFHISESQAVVDAAYKWT